MIRNKKVIAIIPVRKGSKGIPGKNLYELGGVTLLERTINMAKKCKLIDEVYVTTDDEEMYRISVACDVSLPELRPASLARSTSSTVDVIKHTCQILNYTDVFVLLLQVTTPLRSLEDFENVFKIFEENEEALSLVSLNLSLSTHPNKIQKIDGGLVSSYLGQESMVARQLLPEVYELNGAFYLSHITQIENDNSFFNDRTVPYVMPEDRSINLDSKYDLILLEALVERGVVTLD